MFKIQNSNIYISIDAYYLPITPDIPIIGLPNEVVQNIYTQWTFNPSTGLWSCVVELFSPITLS